MPTPRAVPFLRGLALAALLVGASVSAAPAADTCYRDGRRTFDYYVLSLSWSPAYCQKAGNRAPREQCGPGHRFGFIVHGLWPQFHPSGYPKNSIDDSSVPPPLVERMLPIMPGRGLIEHEWDKHGVCSGLGVEGYFAATEAAFRSIALPPVFQTVQTGTRLRTRDIERAFAVANPTLALTGDSIGVVCDGRGFLQEVRLCLGKDLAPRSCGRDVTDTCQAAEIIP